MEFIDRNHCSKPLRRDSHEPPQKYSLGKDADEKPHKPSPKHLSLPTLEGTQEDEALSRSKFLSREEVLKRRIRRIKQLEGYYRRQYWALMEEVRIKHREYYWKYGKSPFIEEENEDELGCERSNGVVESGQDNKVASEFVNAGKNVSDITRCSFSGCKSKAMALTNYCHSHILSDNNQKLYKACTYVIKSAQSGPVICGKTVLRAATPSLCANHLQRTQKHVSLALRKSGLNHYSSNKLAPKFHVIVSEYVKQIQVKRRKANVESKCD